MMSDSEGENRFTRDDECYIVIFICLERALIATELIMSDK